MRWKLLFWRAGRKDSPGVPVLVPDLLLHLGVRQRLQQGAPLVGVARVPDGDLHRGQRVLTATRQEPFIIIIIIMFNSIRSTRSIPYLKA